jgi:hypothetical protein
MWPYIRRDPGHTALPGEAAEAGGPPWQSIWSAAGLRGIFVATLPRKSGLVPISLLVGILVGILVDEDSDKETGGDLDSLVVAILVAIVVDYDCDEDGD